MAPQGSNRKHSHGKHAAHESPTPAAQTPETKGGAPAAKSPASSTPKVLSSKVTSMKFMQRSAKNEKAKDPAAGAAHREAAANADKEDFQGPPKLVLVDGGRHPLLHFVAGRRSFGGMNVAMETWAAQQDKSYRRALRHPLARAPPAQGRDARGPCGARAAGGGRERDPVGQERGQGFDG
ncbi:hypothetical protein T484DRAFT_1744103 [Baffinella frigidus]|nr:hypothetical protein T484DRAFT_1744103 [Cryptophyta sp. CCMP2293]